VGDYTTGDVMVALNKLERGETLTANDYDALGYYGYSLDAVEGYRTGGEGEYGAGTSRTDFENAMHKYADSGSDADAARAASMVTEDAGGSDAAKAMYRKYFGDEAYGRYILGNKPIDQAMLYDELGEPVENKDEILRVYGTDYDTYHDTHINAIPRSEWELAKKWGNATTPIANYDTYEEYKKMHDKWYTAEFGYGYKGEMSSGSKLTTIDRR
jgi:hypothetical protein